MKPEIATPTEGEFGADAGGSDKRKFDENHLDSQSTGLAPEVMKRMCAQTHSSATEKD